MTMVLPPEITHAAIHADIGTLQTFLDQHPGRVDDVDGSDGPQGNKTMTELTLICLSQNPPARVLHGEDRARGSVHVDVRAPDALAEVLPRPAEGALAAPVTRCAWTGEGKAASPLDLRVGDAARILAPLRAVVSERAVLESDGVLEPSLLSSNL